MVIPNTVMKSNNFEIFYKICYFFYFREIYILNFDRYFQYFDYQTCNSWVNMLAFIDHLMNITFAFHVSTICELTTTLWQLMNLIRVKLH